MARLLYSIAWYLALPAVLLSLVWRRRRQPGYLQHLRERFGFSPSEQVIARAQPGHTDGAGHLEAAGGYRQPDLGPLWIHAVSVGETRAAQPLIRAILDQYPHRRILLSHMTPTGRETGAAVFADLIASGRLQQCWLPYDTPTGVRRFLRARRPTLGLLIETELWPNLVAEARRQSVPLALVNARLSEKSLLKGLRWHALIMPALADLSLVLAQTSADSERLARLGRPGVPALGNLKFDIDPPQDLVARGRAWRAQTGAAGIVLAASTREGEEALIVDAWLAARSGVQLHKPSASGLPLLVLVPRHPQRFEEIAALMANRGLNVVRRSSWPSDRVHSTTGVDVVLGDSMGELFAYYAMADVAIIGGSLQPLGGQNLIEACSVGTPAVVGPHMFNFDQVTTDARAAGAVLQVSDVSAAVQEALELIADPDRRSHMSDRGRHFAAQHRGATQRTLRALEPWL